MNRWDFSEVPNSPLKKLIPTLIFGIASYVLPTLSHADHHPVRSASELDYPPFSIVRDDGTADGFSVELMRESLKAMGRNVSFEVHPWSKIKEDLETGRIDALPLVGRTPEREEIFDFTVPYISLYGAVFVRDDLDTIKTLEDLRNYRIGVMQGDNAEEFVRRKNISDHVVATENFEDALIKLSQGYLDAVIAQRLVGLKLINKLNLGNIKTAIAPLDEFRQDFCFAVKEGDKTLLAQLNEGLLIIIEDGTYERLRRKWLGVLDHDQYQRTLYTRIFLGVAGVLSILFIGLFIYQRWQTNRNLIISEEKFRTLYENMVQGVFYQQSDGKLTDCNSAALEIFGLTRDEFLNRTSMNPEWKVIHEDGSEFLGSEHPSMQALRTGKPVENVIAGIFNPLKDSYVWININAIPQFRGNEKNPYQVFVTLHEVTEQKQVEDKLRESELKFRLITGTVNEIFWMSTRGIKKMVFINRAYETVWKKTVESLYENPLSYTEIMHPDDRDFYLEQILVHHEQGEQYECEYRIIMDDDEIKWIQEKGYPVQQVFNNNPLMAGTCIDITNRKRAEEKLHLAADVFTHAREGITITDADANIIDVNSAFTQITGYSREEVLGKNPRILKSGRQMAEFYNVMWNSLIAKGQWYGEIWNRRKNGEVYAEFMNISAVRNAHGETHHYVAVFSDITTQKKHQKQLEHIAHYDALTDLPNRVLLGDRLHQAMAQSDRRRQKLAVIYLDLDGFKAINDTYSHEIGDKVLITLANRMKEAMREGDTIARMGGDEFVSVLIDLNDTKESIPLVTRLLKTVAQPISIDDLYLKVSASLGIVLYPQAEEVTADQLLRQSDQAMYQAKLSGKNRYHIFDDEHDRNLRGYHESLERIQLALNRNEFILYYQPKVNMRSGKIYGVEALIRWQHPDHGLLPPDHFLPITENHPLSVDIGEWVIETALTQLESWSTTNPNLSISMNISAHHLQQPDFTDRLHKLIAAHPSVTSSTIILEVLETSALEDVTRVSQIMKTCNDMGVSFALDDFGTGYSSLTYLKRLPAAQIKIDQSFVRDMLESPEDLAILEGVLSLALAFRLQAIAEGVETNEHAEMLLQLGCEHAQGYAIARPMPVADLMDWSKTWKPPQKWKTQRVVSRDNIPLLFAGIEHKMWIRTVEEYLKGNTTVLPPLDVHECRFGIWLDSQDMENYSEDPVFQIIDSLHHQVHELSTELITLRAKNMTTQALGGLGKLYILRDNLLEQLKLLLASSH
ncbi:MAG: EAL domain-containing protein [Candidatus Thiodiazotropha sp. (ex Codakia rugifera)]|nr:EAL domain-containing protein [Candidatus Thiodiazotropha sp. (ex Codakia rugifera)]